jgi:iron(III) transport system ATP-binding protein
VGDYLVVERLRKTFGRETAVDGVSFGVEQGRILTLLGPSGCGKTTTLRCIAGLEHPDEGAIVVDGDAVTDAARGVFVAPERRSVGMVFQSYAVWPHMTVFRNVSYPLEVRRWPRQEIAPRVDQALKMVGLARYRDQYATKLSGGQQQRVALARAMIFNPRLLLFDEPLSNLDAKLREQLRAEIVNLQRTVGITSIYVTHDQAEAMVISDQIIVMNHGRIEQQGDAHTIYTRPANRFVAQFVGLANMLPGRVAGVDGVTGAVRIDVASDADLRATLHARAAGAAVEAGRPVFVMIRPEDVEVGTPGAARRADAPARRADAPEPSAGRENRLTGTVASAVYMGTHVDYVVDVAGVKLRAQARSSTPYRQGDAVSLLLPFAACLCIPDERPPH